MERRDLLQKAAVTVGAALLAAPKAALAANNNSTVTVASEPVNNRRRITAVDPDGISSLVVLSRLSPTGSLSVQSISCGGATTCFVTIAESAFQSRYHWVVVLDSGNPPSADMWRINPGNTAPFFEG